MGYTNYWYQYRDFTDSEWEQIVDGFNNWMENDTFRSLVDLGAVNIREPFQRAEYGDAEIYFDGGEGGTNELPYDIVVWKMLKYIKFFVLDPTKEDFTIANDHGVEILSVKSEEMLTPLKKEKRHA